MPRKPTPGPVRAEDIDWWREQYLEALLEEDEEDVSASVSGKPAHQVRLDQALGA